MSFDIPRIGVYQVGDLDASDVFAPVNGQVSVEPLDVGNADYTMHTPKATGADHQSLSLHLPEISLQAQRQFMIGIQVSRNLDVDEETYWLYNAHGAFKQSTLNMRCAVFVGVGTQPVATGPGATTELADGRRTVCSSGSAFVHVEDVFVSRKTTNQSRINRPVFLGVEIANISASQEITVKGDIALSLMRAEADVPMFHLKNVF